MVHLCLHRCLNYALVLVCDVTLLLRCYIIWKDQSWICAIPGITYISSIVFAITHIAILLPQKQVLNGLEAAWLLASVVGNVKTAGLISFRLIFANRRLNAVLSDSRPEANVFTKVSNTLIETALPVAAMAALFPKGIEEQQKTNMDTLAFSPQLIIYRVTPGRTWANSSGSCDEITSQLVHSIHGNGPITFARPSDSEEPVSVNRTPSPSLHRRPRRY
ncbi:hypothetical protein FA15DRAFT_85585 [Coprinopsis marcescibilis]|uniref:Transmembrane protein n=1 Tax=Coprinopsis marcescibilis TaxID=230819 RepID=A0A5C3KMF9_COPMA|nr:hypothetical protein FA15DRAFT_85585 [Coprinopsis marcescibilis]